MKLAQLGDRLRLVPLVSQWRLWQEVGSKNVRLIVQPGNDYLVGVKDNQPKLLQQFTQAAQQ